MLQPDSFDETYEATAGRLCLDFANTLAWRGSDRQHDWLDSYANLIEWGKIVGELTEQTALSLYQEAASRPAQTAAVLDKAIQLREAIYGIFSATASDSSPDTADLDTLNAALAEALVHIRVRPGPNAFVWDWVSDGIALDRMLWPVAWSAADLLTSEDIDRVGECQGDGCGWLFIDMSRNHSRRWCDMGDCGNRAKARRYYRRKKQART
jgi:predicted RNA-binding Zn ribbon-like protein